MDGEYLIKGAVTGAIIFGLDMILMPMAASGLNSLARFALEGVGIVVGHSLIYPESADSSCSGKKVVVASGLLAVTDALLDMNRFGGAGAGTYAIKVIIQGLTINWGLENFGTGSRC